MSIESKFDDIWLIDESIKYHTCSSPLYFITIRVGSSALTNGTSVSIAIFL